MQLQHDAHTSPRLASRDPLNPVCVLKPPAGASFEQLLTGDTIAAHPCPGCGFYYHWATPIVNRAGKTLLIRGWWLLPRRACIDAPVNNDHVDSKIPVQCSTWSRRCSDQCRYWYLPWWSNLSRPEVWTRLSSQKIVKKCLAITPI
jgi:hypothetical protein